MALFTVLFVAFLVCLAVVPKEILKGLLALAWMLMAGAMVFYAIPLVWGGLVWALNTPIG